MEYFTGVAEVDAIAKSLGLVSNFSILQQLGPTSSYTCVLQSLKNVSPKKKQLKNLKDTNKFSQFIYATL
jgi:hypothetical protein